MNDFKGRHFEGQIILWAVRWYCKYGVSYRELAEMLEERLLREHISTVCKRYGDRIFTWDVVNEAIDPTTGGLRADAFSKHLGETLLDIAFDAARQAAPFSIRIVGSPVPRRIGNSVPTRS